MNENVDIGTQEPMGMCRLCLATDRKTSSLEGYVEVYKPIVECMEDAMVCWECRAMVRRVDKFRRQAARAEQLLQSTRPDGYPVPCLSQLGYATKTSYDSEFVWDNGWLLEVDLKLTPQPPLHLETHDSEIEVKELEITVEPKVEPDDIDTWPETSELTYDVPIEPQEPKEPTPPPIRKHKTKKQKRKEKEVEVKQQLEEELEEDLAAICTRVHETPSEVSSQRAARLRSPRFSTAKHTCTECALSFHTGGGLERHLARLHTQESTGVPCPTCKCVAVDAAALVSHVQRHLVLKCRRCRFTTRHANNMKRHAAGHDTQHTISCDFCGKQFKNRQHFSIHRATHTSKQRFECDECGRVYSTRNQMFRHLRSHRKPFLCDICGKTFSDKTYLACHTLAHTGAAERRFECSICHKRYVNKFKLEVHARFHTGEKPYACVICGKSYREKAQLAAHNRKHHADTIESPPKRKRTFQRTKSAFVNERFTESKYGQTEEEPRTVDAEKNEDPKPKIRERKDFVCSFCGKKFKDKWRLKFHLAVHSDDRPYKCDECDLTFKYQSGLWTHKLLHKGGKPHQCTICGAQFTQKGNLTAHLKIHTDEKPFECSICGHKFRMRRNLRNHFKIHASVDGKRPPFDDKPAY